MTEQIEKRRKKGWMNLRVSQIYDETHDTKTLVLEDADDGGRQFDYEAGQYLTFRFDNIEAKPLVRSYTLSSSPCQGDYIAFTVKRVESGIISNWLCDNVKVGDILRARGPIGRFGFDRQKHLRHLVFIGAGSGVTPFISIMREYGPKLGQEGYPLTMTLLVAYRSRQDLICWKEISEIKKFPGCRVEVTLTRDEATGEGFWAGRPDPAMLYRLIDGRYKECTFYTCGPEQMMEMVVQHCREHGACEDQVMLESFF